MVVPARASLARARAASYIAHCLDSTASLYRYYPEPVRRIAFGGLHSGLDYVVSSTIELWLQVVRLRTVSAAALRSISTTTQKGRASTSSVYSHGIKSRES